MSLNIEAGLPTQIRQLEKRLKDMDVSKIKPALVHEITETIKNLKQLLKEKQDKRDQRKKDKESKTQDVAKEAAPATTLSPTIQMPGATTAPTSTTTTAPAPDDQKVNCPLCGGLTFNDNAALQQHMEFTHASDIAPTTPGQKLDKTVAAVDDMPGVIVPDSVKKHDEIVERVEKDPKIAPHIVSEKENDSALNKKITFNLDQVVKPVRGSESKGKVMRHDFPDDLVYVMWEEGTLKDRDGFGGYYPNELSTVEEEPVEAAMSQAEPICKNCETMSQKQGDLKGNYEALLKDLKEERDAHYAQGNHSWTARLDQKIIDLQKAIDEKFGNTEKTAAGGPELIRQVNKATSGHGYDSTVYSLTNGRFQQNVPLKINDTTVRMRQPENGTFEVKYPGMDWRPVLEPEFQEWLAEWKVINQKNNQKEGKAQNDSNGLVVMDHSPAQAQGITEGKDETGSEFQSEWAMPVTSATKLNVLKRELLATPSTEGYDISAEGKKLFNIKGKDSQPMNKKQLEFCAQIELTRNMKKAKLVEKIAHLEAGSTVFVMAEDKAARRVKFASIEHGVRGWCSSSKIKLSALESQPVNHNGHSDKVLGHSGSETLLDCVEGGPIWVNSTELLQGNRPAATPESLNDVESKEKGFSKVVRPKSGHHVQCADCGKSFETYDELKKHDSTHKESEIKCPKCKGVGIPGHGSCPECGGYATEMKERKTADQGQCSECGKKGYISTYTDKQGREFDLCQDHYQHARDKKAAKECADCHGHFEGAEGETCPTCGRFAVQKTAGSSTLTPGTRIRISDGSGISSGTEGTITTRWEFNSNVQTNERGVPNVGGAYKPVDWSREVPIKLDDGSYMTMFKNRVIPVEQKTALETALPKQILPQRGDVNEMNPSNGPSDEDVQQKAWELFKQHWDGLSSEQMDEVYRALGVTSSLKTKADMPKEMSVCTKCEAGHHEMCDTDNCVCKNSKCASEKTAEYKDKGVGEFGCFECSKRFVSKGKLDEHMDASKHKSPKTSSLSKYAHIRHENGKWIVYNHDYKKKLGTYTSKAEAVKRLRQIEYFKHHGAIRPFSRKVIAEALANPYQSLTDHITDMRGRMSEVQDRIQTAPAIKTAGEDNSKLDLPGLFADLTQGIELLETKLGGDENADPEIHAQIEELENKLWTLEESCGITPKISDEEKAEPEHKEIVEDIEKEADWREWTPKYCKKCNKKLEQGEGASINGKTYCEKHIPYGKEAANETMATKCTCGHMWKDHTDDNDCSFEDCDCKGFKRLHKQADQVTDETIVTNDPNAVVDPTAVTPPPMIQNVQPTDDSNLEIPTQAPTSPLPAGQKWQWDSTVGKYVAMTDPNSVNKTI